MWGPKAMGITTLAREEALGYCMEQAIKCLYLMPTSTPFNKGGHLGVWEVQQWAGQGRVSVEDSH